MVRRRTMAKRKRSRREISEQARVNAENMPSVRKLRELAARATAELEERRKIDPTAR